MVKDLFWSVQCEYPRRNFLNQCSSCAFIISVLSLEKQVLTKLFTNAPFHINCTFLSLCNKTRNSYCKQVAGINWFKNGKNQSFAHEVYFLSIYFL